MAKLKNRQKAFKAKHWLFYNSNYNKSVEIRKVRFDISKFRRVIKYLYYDADHGIGFPNGKRGDKCVTFQKGVCLDYKNMTFSILLQPGVKRGKTA